MNFATLWEREVGGTIRGVSFLRDRKGVVVASVRAVRMYDYDGEMQWRFSLDSDFCDIAPLPNGVCVVACTDRLIFLGSEGEKLKETPLSKEAKAIAVNSKIGILADSELLMLDADGDSMVRAVLDFEAECIAHNDAGFVVAGHDSIESLETKGGSRWRKQVDTRIDSITARGQHAYLVSGNAVHKLDKDGEEIWSRNLEGRIEHIGIGKGLLAVLEDKAIMLDMATSDQVWEVQGDFALGSIEENVLALARERTIVFLSDVGEEEVFYEIMCRSKEKCGTFVSSRFLKTCPKCGAEKIILRVIKKKLGEDSKDI